MAYVCQYCNASFATYLSLRAHQNGRSRGGIVSCGTQQTLDRYSDDSDGDISDGAASAAPAVITNPYDIKHGICRRHQDDCTLGACFYFPGGITWDMYKNLPDIILENHPGNHTR